MNSKGNGRIVKECEVNEIFWFLREFVSFEIIKKASRGNNVKERTGGKMDMKRI